LIAHQSTAISDGYCLCTAVDPQLGQDPLDVGSHGLGADEELAGDALLTDALGKQLEHLVLSSGEWDICMKVGTRELIQQATRTDDYLIGIERLREVIVRTDEQTGDPVRRFGSLSG